MIRFLVGSLYTIENEFEQCCQSIRQQKHVELVHFVVRNLPNKEAHDTLYRNFMEHAKEYDFFVKVDADMVLARPTVLSEIGEQFIKHPEYGHIEVAVQDWFSDQLIVGLSAFRSSARWELNEEQLFVDIGPSNVKKLKEETGIAPAAFHCPNPSGFQAFHFGVHRATKVMQCDAAVFDADRSAFQWRILRAVYKHYRGARDKRLGYALLGAELVYRGAVQADCVDCNTPVLARKFSNIEAMGELGFFWRAGLSLRLGGGWQYCDLRHRLILIRGARSPWSVVGIYKLLAFFVRRICRRLRRLWWRRSVLLKIRCWQRTESP